MGRRNGRSKAPLNSRNGRRLDGVQGAGSSAMVARLLLLGARLRSDLAARVTAPVLGVQERSGSRLVTWRGRAVGQGRSVPVLGARCRGERELRGEKREGQGGGEKIEGELVKCPDPLGLKCDTIIVPGG
jgi:hypothetical protein